MEKSADRAAGNQGQQRQFLLFLGFQLPPESQPLDAHIDWLLGTLSPREEKVIRLRFGLSDGYMYTQERIARELYVRQPTVSRIENKALRKLKHPARRRTIEERLLITPLLLAAVAEADRRCRHAESAVVDEILLEIVEERRRARRAAATA